MLHIEGKENERPPNPGGPQHLRKRLHLLLPAPGGGCWGGQSPPCCTPLFTAKQQLRYPPGAPPRCQDPHSQPGRMWEGGQRLLPAPPPPSPQTPPSRVGGGGEAVPATSPRRCPPSPPPVKRFPWHGQGWAPRRPVAGDGKSRGDLAHDNRNDTTASRGGRSRAPPLPRHSLRPRGPPPRARLYATTNSDFMSALTSGFHTESSKSRSRLPSLETLLLLLVRLDLRFGSQW